jgi:hypothetical protein
MARKKQKSRNTRRMEIKIGITVDRPMKRDDVLQAIVAASRGRRLPDGLNITYSDYTRGTGGNVRDIDNLTDFKRVIQAAMQQMSVRVEQVSN